MPVAFRVLAIATPLVAQQSVRLATLSGRIDDPAGCHLVAQLPLQIHAKFNLG
jgi:hypothetical protein